MPHEIWQLIDSREPGGIETHVLQLAVSLAEFGERPRVVFLDDHGEHPLRGLLEQHAIPVTVLDGRMQALWRALQAHRPRVLHTHGYKAGLSGRLAARLVGGIRVFSTYHAGETPAGRVALYDRLDRYTAWLAHGVYAVSHAIATRIPGRPPVLNNFVDTASAARSTGTAIAFVGRLSAEKGPDRFVDLARRRPDTLFHVYGDGPLGDALRQAAPPNLVFHGQQASMGGAWQDIGLLVMPSRHEGLPMAALEAMARGIAVLASAVGGLPDLIDDDRNGWTVDPSDSEGFAERLAQWTRMSEQRRREIGSAAIATIERGYSSRAVVPGILAAYTARGPR